MELFTDDRRIANPDDFPQHISPFPATIDLLFSNRTVVADSPGANHQNLPPQKLRPIRGTGRSPSSSQANDLIPAAMDAGGVDRTLENLGLLREQVCGLSGESSEYFEFPERAEVGDAVANDDEAQYLVADGSLGVGSGTGVGNQNNLGGLSEDESISSLDDDQDDDDLSADVKESVSWKRKRKSRKKLEDFLENLVMKVIEKQELMHKQLIEMIEGKERERIIREEAWKRQEMERVKRDEEIRAQETSRNLALISLIQNVMVNNGIEIPECLTSISHLRNDCSRDEGDDVPIEKDFKYIPGNKRRPETEVQVHKSWPETEMQVQKRWPEAEVQALIMLRTTLEQKCQAKGSKGPNIWDEVSAGMFSMGYNRTAKKCKEKWENMNKYFKRSLGSDGKKRRNETKTCPYFQELDILYRNGYVGLQNISNIANHEIEHNSNNL